MATTEPLTEIPSSGGMPTVEELGSARRALYDAHEFCISPIQQRVLRLLNSEDEGAKDITYENVGTLLVELTDMQYIARQILDDIGVLEKSREDLTSAVFNGGAPLFPPRFDESGRPQPQ